MSVDLSPFPEPQGGSPPPTLPPHRSTGPMARGQEGVCRVKRIGSHIPSLSCLPCLDFLLTGSSAPLAPQTPHSGEQSLGRNLETNPHAHTYSWFPTLSPVPLLFSLTLRFMGGISWQRGVGGKWRGTQSLIVSMKQARKGKGWGCSRRDGS